MKRIGKPKISICATRFDCYLKEMSITRESCQRRGSCVVGLEGIKSFIMWSYRNKAVFLFIFWCLPFLATSSYVAEYLAQRQQILDIESRQILGGSLTLDALEEVANTLLMEAKEREYAAAVAGGDFPPASHYFNMRPLMLQSEVFQIIRQMPKGELDHLISHTEPAIITHCLNSIRL